MLTDKDKAAFKTELQYTKALEKKLKADRDIDGELLEMLIDAIEMFQGRLVVDFAEDNKEIDELKRIGNLKF